ncbi:hypothetical protein LGZ99_02425 [Photorhabdus temperata]|uniref:Uncharacterized protein n=1 Tax=Photorhabdus temperata subsp. temperata Meg1 TaxID=1393735 RepID=A0A081S009_PHOTE|nr:hypothetical protein [Photorhabdus temperata]KER04262.1 hypothetical protein MEG1DRAFT_01032 [Photorhabdus temperata subsp. temperata Meg1]MCT8346101.1 hypothetical protein [Photorhabdus temperata]
MEKSKNNVFYDFENDIKAADGLLVILSDEVIKNQLGSESAIDALKNRVADFKSLIEQKNNLQKYIENQEVYRQEKIRDLAINRISVFGRNMGNFLRFAKNDERYMFTYGFIESAKAVLGRHGDWVGVWNEYIITPAMELYNATLY